MSLYSTTEFNTLLQTRNIHQQIWNSPKKIAPCRGYGKAGVARKSERDGAPLAVLETAEDEAEDVDNLPDAEEAYSDELEEAGDNLAGVQPMQAADQKETQKCQNEGRAAAERGDIRIVMHGNDYGVG